MTNKQFSKSALIFSIITSFFIILLLLKDNIIKKPTVKVGILHSLTGSLAFIEKTLIDGSLLAIKEINEAGGVIGKQIEPIIADGKSDPSIFAREAKKLIVNNGVSVIFGCWNTASRKIVKPIVEKYNNILFYPAQYEGFETPSNIIHTGAAPNQQLIPGIFWCLNNLGKNFFLVGTDFPFSRAYHKLIKKMVIANGGKIIDDQYMLLGDKKVDHIISKIVSKKPDVIINTIDGDSNVYFFKELRSAGITPEKIPTMSFRIAEPQLQKMNIDHMAGDYATWGYFQSIIYPKNLSFVKRFKQEYGSERVTSNSIEAAYFGVYLWKSAVEQAGTTEPNIVLPNTKLQAFLAPQGIVYIDIDNNHTWKFVRIGKILKNGQFFIIWESEGTIAPQPYPNLFKET